MFLHVTEAQHIADYRIHVSFNDGTSGEIDLGASLDGPIFEPLRDVDYFKAFSIIGHTLAWPNGPISPRSTCTPWPRNRRARNKADPPETPVQTELFGKIIGGDSVIPDVELSRPCAVHPPMISRTGSERHVCVAGCMHRDEWILLNLLADSRHCASLSRDSLSARRDGAVHGCRDAAM